MEFACPGAESDLSKISFGERTALISFPATPDVDLLAQTAVALCMQSAA
jgi:hypothetical protein